MNANELLQQALDALEGDDGIVQAQVADAIRAHLAAAQPAPVPDQPQAEPVANNDEVICPACCTQFRAIPQNVQRLMLDAGFEPPFTHPAAPVPVPLTDEQIDAMWREWVGVGDSTIGLIRMFARAIERAHGIAASPEQHHE